MRNSTAASTEEYLLDVLSAVELFFSVPCLLCNFYFILRFSRVKTFSPNLRIVVISTNIFAALMAIFRPLLHFGLGGDISVADGNERKAALYYAGRFCVEVCLYALNGKFLLVGVERALALKYRATYEFFEGRLAIRMVSCYLIAIIAILGLKIVAYLLAFHDTEPTDDWLAHAFVTDRSLPFYVFCTVYATVSWFIGVVQFRRLRLFAVRHRYDGRTLSESFQIKQVLNVVEVLGPLLYAFGFGVFYCTVLYSINCYLVLWKGYELKAPLVVLLANAEYLAIGAYTLFSTMYMIWYFPPLRAAALNDIQRLCRIKIESHRTHKVDPHDERQFHFDYLAKAWK